MQNWLHAFFAITVAILLTGCPEPSRPPLTFDPTTLPEAHVGQPYHALIKIGHGTDLFRVMAVPPDETSEALPAGLTLQFNGFEKTVTIEGTPTSACRATFTLKVECHGTQVSGQTGTHEYELIVR